MDKLLFYDTEIIRAIPLPHEENDPKYQYCEGWDDFENMGISVVATWRNFEVKLDEGTSIITPYPAGIVEAFPNETSAIPLSDGDNGTVNHFSKLNLFALLADQVIGFNSIAFDDKLLAVNMAFVQPAITTTCDLLRQVRISSGQPPEYQEGLTKKGYSLGNLAKYNLNKEKMGTGIIAPKWWQDGFIQYVTRYCTLDVLLLKQLYDLFIEGKLRDPNTHKILHPRLSDDPLYVGYQF